MNTNTKKIISISIALMLTLAVVGTAAAEKAECMNRETNEDCRQMRHKDSGCMDGPSHMAGPMKGICGITLEKLIRMDLSDQQKTRVANILAAARDENRQMKDRLLAAKKNFSDTIQPENTLDESAVRESFKKMAAVMENLAVQRAKIMSELKTVLNEDQLGDLTAHHLKKSKMKNRMKQMKNRVDVHRAMLDTWIDTYADSQKKR